MALEPGGLSEGVTGLRPNVARFYGVLQNVFIQETISGELPECPATDDIDRRILRTLQRDGRVSNLGLANAVHLSPAATLERVRRLHQAGVILGYGARLNPAKLDRALLIFVEITLDRTTAGVFDDFARAVRNTPDILECHMVAGGFDYLVKARVRDMAAYRKFLGDTLVMLPGIRQTHTYTVMEEVKSENELPVA